MNMYVNLHHNYKILLEIKNLENDLAKIENRSANYNAYFIVWCSFKFPLIQFFRYIATRFFD